MLRRSTLLLLLVPFAAAVSGCSIGTPDPATNVTDRSATLNGSLYSNQEGDVQYWFKYGETTSYGSQTPEHTLHVAAGRDIKDPIGVSIPVTGLKPETTYHFQLCTAPPRDGCVQQDQSFTTGPAGGASGIAFISGFRIWRMDPDGSNQAPLTTSATTQISVSFSPDARKVVYLSQRGGFDIYTSNIDGSDEQRLTTTGDNQEPTWSPDGRKIAFMSNRSGDYELYVMDADGSNQVNVTNAPGVDQHADWSPDGKRLVFIHQIELMTMAADGSDVKDLHQLGTFPAWSPDGREIAFTQGPNDNAISFIPAQGGTVTGIGDEKGVAVNDIVWSPDGTKLAFEHSQPDTGFDIWTINRDGTGQTNVSQSDSFATQPDWSPRG